MQQVTTTAEALAVVKEYVIQLEGIVEYCANNCHNEDFVEELWRRYEDILLEWV